jgi:phosphoglycerate dehydrogenase-like enzyme
MKKLKILAISSSSDERFHQTWDPLIDYSRFQVLRPTENASEEEICNLIEDVEILMTDGLHFRPVNKELIESGQNLKLILCPTVGYDEVDLEAARENGIPVVASSGISAKPIAEYVIMAAIYLLKHIKLMDSEFQERRWSKPLLVGPRQPRELGSQTIGILGCGSVGQQVARLAKAIGSRVLYHNRRRLPTELEDELRVEYVPFDTLLRMSDVVSVNVPLTNETRGMIGADELAKMKERAILINTARGNIVDEQALADAIESGHLGGAAVDAFAIEPDIQNCPLIGLENVLLTPHMCSRSPELVKRVEICVNENLDNLYYGRELVRVVN